MHRTRRRPALLLAVALAASACTSSSGSAAETTTAEPATSVQTTAPPTTTPPTTTPSTTVPPCTVPESRSYTTNFQDRDRAYDIVAPDTIVDGAPLVVLLHGFTSRPDRILRHSGFGTMGPEAGVVVVAPLATGDPTSWEILAPGDPDDPAYEGPNDLGFITTLVQDLRAEYPCLGDVWATGLSAGSAMAGFYMCSDPDGLVGVGLVAALIPAVCEATSISNMWIFHGTGDIVVSYTGGEQPVGDEAVNLPGIESSAAAWAELASCGDLEQRPLAPDVELRSYPGCNAGSSVALHSYVDGNHNWPGGAEDQLPPIIDSLPVTCVLLHQITGSTGDVYDTCTRDL